MDTRIKHNYQDVKDYIESFNNFKLLSNEYINYKSNLKIQCPQGHIFYRTFDNFKSKNQTCPECNKINNLHNLTISIDIIIEEVNFYNFKIIEWIDEYKNGNSEFKLECPNGHIYKTKVKYFRQHHNCPCCSKKFKPDFDFVKQEFFNRNLILLSTNYNNCKTKLSFMCPIHRNIIQFIDWSHFYHRNQGCKYCSYEIYGESKRLDQNFVFDAFKSKGLIVIEGEKYLQNNIPIKFICEKHPFIIQEIPYCKISNDNNYGCIYCSYDARKGENHWKGGISPLNYYLREHIIPWKQISYKLSNGKCIVSNKKAETIHHLYPFSKILEYLLKIINLPIYDNINKYTEDELILLEEECLRIHYQYPFGVCLSKDLHKEFHKIYGVKNFTPENFQEFYYFKTGKLFNFTYYENDNKILI